MNYNSNQKGFIVIYLFIPLLLSITIAVSSFIDLTESISTKQKLCRKTLFKISNNKKEKNTWPLLLQNFQNKVDINATISPNLQNLKDNQLITLFWQHSWLNQSIQQSCQWEL